MRLIIALLAAVLCTLTGCGPKVPSYPAPNPQMMAFLKGMYEVHGAKAELAGDWVIVDGGKLRTRAAHSDPRQYPQGLVLQADFISVLPSGEHIVESFAGTGTNLNDALKDAAANFQDSTFHALFSAVLGRHSDEAEIANLDIGGIPRVVTFGSVRTRGTLPADSWPKIYSELEANLKNSGLPRGLHWVRYFYAHFPNEAPTLEVLLDNKPWIEQKTKAAAFPWPASDKFYTVRLFFVVQDK